jgi:hypothetical protein
LLIIWGLAVETEAAVSYKVPQSFRTVPPMTIGGTVRKKKKGIELDVESGFLKFCG